MKATTRKPRGTEQLTFYSEYDVWLFVAVGDTRVCPLCRMYETAEWWRGDQLRTEFPYHVIVDANTIAGPDADGRGLVHPHCRCYLVRVIMVEPE